jgi:HSP20 family molecular chaperone IbpA
MQPEMIRVMSSQVRAIHRAITGDEIPEPETPTEETRPPDEEIARRFLELEAIVRTVPELAERVPQVWFRPPLDVIADDDAILLELALPGIDRDDVTVTCIGDELVIGGLRRDPHTLVGRVFHAELPRGPFRRVVPLPFALAGTPRWELERGVLRVHLNVPANVPKVLGEGHTQGERANDDDGSR